MIITQAVRANMVIPHPRTKNPVVIYEAVDSVASENTLKLNELHQAKTEAPSCLIKQGDIMTAFMKDLEVLGIRAVACNSCLFDPNKEEGVCKACYKEG